MFGLEATIFLPLLGGGKLSAQLPFFPADIAFALTELPEPRLLVTTPFHLRKLMDAPIAIPALAAVLSATAALPAELARQVESRLGAPVLEIYGSTETGALATRRPAVNVEWETYPGIAVSQTPDGALATAAHFDGPQALNDVLELTSPSRFRLLGRNSDMVNIVGKRSSLAYLNQILLGIPGVQDGVFCLPDSPSASDATRLAAFVVAPTLTPTDILTALRLHLDPVFLPRPMVFLDALPRDGNGKIPVSTIVELLAQHLPQRA